MEEFKNTRVEAGEGETFASTVAGVAIADDLTNLPLVVGEFVRVTREGDEGGHSLKEFKSFTAFSASIRFKL